MYPLSLLDTDILSELFKKNPKVLARATEYIRIHRHLNISHITKYEILKGLKTKKANTQIKLFNTFCNAAIRRNEGVIITYLAAGKDDEHAFLLFPKQIIESGRHTYVQGWSAHQPTRIRLLRGRSSPSGQVRQFRIDRILSVEPRPVRDRSPTGYVKDKIHTKKQNHKQNITNKISIDSKISSCYVNLGKSNFREKDVLRGII